MQFGGNMGMGGMNPGMGMTGMGMGGMNPGMGMTGMGMGGMNPGMGMTGMGMGGMNPGMGGMMPNMGMGGMMPNMGMTGMMPNMGMGGMMPNMGMAGMGGMMPGMMPNMGGAMPTTPISSDVNTSIDDPTGWNLIFENQNDKKSLTIRISEQKLVKEAISMYMLKSGRTDKCKFIFNNKELFGEMKICQSGLNNLSRILVISTQNVIGAN